MRPSHQVLCLTVVVRCADQPPLVMCEGVLIGGIRSSYYPANQKAKLEASSPQLGASSENWKVGRGWESGTQAV
jgi:hypothetical protein